MLIKILLAGDGGQGIQTIADVISQSAFDQGNFVSQIPNYGLEQRGGVSLSFLQISDEIIVYPKFTSPDILLVMSDQARERTKQYDGAVQVFDIKDYKEKIAVERVPTQSSNIFFLGKLSAYLQGLGICEMNKIEQRLKEKLSTKPNWEENKKVFERAITQ